MRQEMRKEAYSVDHQVLDQIKELDLSSYEIGILFKMINAAWLSESQYGINGENRDVANLINESEDDVNAVMDKLLSCKKPIFEAVINMSDFSSTIVCKPLFKQITLHRNWVKEQELIVRKKKIAIKKGSLKHRIETEKNAEANYGYLMPNERCLLTYKGWMPTNRFDLNGQVFYINKSLLTEMEDTYPNEDLNAQLQQIFYWLTKNPMRRKTIAAMKFFIFSWLERSTSHAQLEHEFSTNDFDDIESELDALLGAAN
jgi:hypothetical protein